MVDSHNLRVFFNEQLLEYSLHTMEFCITIRDPGAENGSGQIWEPDSDPGSAKNNRSDRIRAQTPACSIPQGLYHWTFSFPSSSIWSSDSTPAIPEVKTEKSVVYYGHLFIVTF